MIEYSKTNLNTSAFHTVNIYDGDVVIAYFYICGFPANMGITVEDAFLGLGLTKTMILEMLAFADLDESSFLYIDTDASVGFWDHIGMQVNPELEDCTVPTYGYEKRITVAALRTYANKN